MIAPAAWAEAHSHPASFAEYLTKHEKFMRPAHVELLSRTIAKAVLDGGNGRFIVTMPPRHGKSTICSAWLPFWFLNLFPHKHVMLASYGSEFAKKWGLRVRRLAAVHKDMTLMRLSPDSKSAGEWETTRGGGMKSVGIDGDATGRGADLLIIDDPVKNAKDARSEVVQESNWNAWRETFRTRVEPNGTVLVVQTRWHESDLAGKLLEADNEPGDDGNHRWTRIDFPAIAEGDDVLGRVEGEALWPERYPIEALEDIRDAEDGVGRRGFASLYQQRPSPEEGGMFQRADFRYYVDEPDVHVLKLPDGGTKRVYKNKCWIAQVVDTAMKEKADSDYTVVMTYAVTEDRDWILLHRDRVKLEVPKQWPFIQGIRARWRHKAGYRFMAIEDKGSGIGLIQTARMEGDPVKELKAQTDKVTRATPASIHCENGMVYFPQNAPWLTEFEDELLVFPNGAHDDQVDCFAYAIRTIRDAGVSILSSGAGIAAKPRHDLQRVSSGLQKPSGWR